MRRLACPIFLVILTFLCISVSAQQKTIAGKVLGDNNQPLTGATVRIKGTSRVTQTDATGSFSIKASKGETIDITHVGYEPSSLKIGDSNSISVSLKTSASTMSEVTVVAMDIKRNPKELGYSAQKVSGDQIAQTQP